MNTKFSPGHGIAVHSDKYNCSISLKIELPSQVLMIDCMGDEFPEPLAALPDSERLPGWKNLFQNSLNKVFSNEKSLNEVWDRVELPKDKREQVRDWLISALTYTATPMIPPGLKQALA